MADLKIKKVNEFDTKELKIFSGFKSKEEGVVMVVEGKNSKEVMWVGISLNDKDVKRVIKFLQKQVE